MGYIVSTQCKCFTCEIFAKQCSSNVFKKRNVWWPYLITVFLFALPGEVTHGVVLTGIHSCCTTFHYRGISCSQKGMSPGAYCYKTLYPAPSITLPQLLFIYDNGNPDNFQGWVGYCMCGSVCISHYYPTLHENTIEFVMHCSKLGIMLPWMEMSWSLFRI